MKRLGPDLKLPNLKGLNFRKAGISGSNLKVPPFLVDLYWDLWDRRLLPLVVLVVVAIAAVPFVLGGGSEEPSESAGTSATVAQLATEAGSPSTLTVVQAEPGLRDYHRRLGYLKPTDPFKQHEVAASSVAHLNPMPTTTTSTTKSPAPTSTTTTSTGTASSGPAPESEPAPSGGGEESSTGGGSLNSGGHSGGEGEHSITLLAYAIDVKITRVEPDPANAASNTYENAESKKKPESSIKHRVLPLTKLPGDKAPVVTYMGPSTQGKPLLLVSRDVKSIFGEVKCLEGDEVCQLVEVEPGFPVVFVYGANEVRYRINVLKIEPVAVAHN